MSDRKDPGHCITVFLQTEETPGGQSKALIALGFFISTCFTMLCSCHGIPALGQLHVTEEQGISFLFCRGNFLPFPQANPKNALKDENSWTWHLGEKEKSSPFPTASVKQGTS